MNDDERELRDALATRAAAVPVGRADEPGLIRRLAVARRRRRQARLAGAVAALVMVLGAASLVAADDPKEETVTVGPDPSSTTTIFDPTTTTPDTAPVDTSLPVPPPSVAPATTVAPAPVPTTIPRTTTTTTRTPLPPVPDDAVWPPPGSTTVFPSPDKATLDFARRFLGMVDPQLTALNTTGDRATMNVTPGPTAGINMVVSLRRVEGRGWVVTGSAAPSIQVDQPAAGSTVASPLVVRGRTQAFEGHVDVEIRRDGATTPIGRAFGTGASDAMAPFETTVTFTRPSTARGTVVVSAPNAADGDLGPLAATVIRVSF